MDISQGKELSGPEIQVPNTARMAEKRTLFDFQFHSFKKNAHLSESKSEECVSGEQRDKDNHVSDIDGHSLIQTVMQVKRLMKSDGQSI